MPTIRLTLCQEPPIRAESDGHLDLALPAKSLALLAFLALEPGPHSREELTTLLWGESPEDKAAASLRQALSHLRTTLDHQLRIDRSTVELDPSVPCDVSWFRRNAAREPDAALAVDVSRFLAGLTLRNCPGFEEWLDGTRRSLSRRYCQLLGDGARAAAAQRDWRRAAELAGRWLQLDPTSDDAAHRFVEARYLAGDESAALAAYADFRARLEGAEARAPNLALRELVKRIESGRPRAPMLDQDDDWQDGAPDFTGALVGRGPEWEAMLGAWAHAAKGASQIIVVEGEAGIGKTRLADDFSRWLRANGASVLRTGLFEAAVAVPFSSVLEVLRAALKVPGVAGADPAWLAEVSRLLPEIRRQFPALPEPSPASGNSLLFEAASELLQAAADDHPIAILVDDLQWCDQDSCTMIHYLVRRLERSPVLWCVTVTLGGLDRDAPPARLTRALRGSPAATRISLAPLTPDEVWSLVRELGRITSATAGRRLSSRMHEVTGGNPFYLIELLKTLFAQGWLTIHPSTREWIVASGHAEEVAVGAMSPTVQEAIAQRVARLPDDLHAILMSIAVAGPGCSTSLLSHVHGISRLRAAAIGDALVERQFAIEDGGRYRCAHPVIASAVQAEMTKARRREIHRAIALAMIASAEGADEPVDPGAVAFHAEQGGEPRLAYEHALAASRASRDRAAFEEALAWLDLASSCAVSPEQLAVADQATAALLEAAGWQESRPVPRRSGAAAAISRGDFDLAGA